MERGRSFLGELRLASNRLDEMQNDISLVIGLGYKICSLLSLCKYQTIPTEPNSWEVVPTEEGIADHRSLRLSLCFLEDDVSKEYTFFFVADRLREGCFRFQLYLEVVGESSKKSWSPTVLSAAETVAVHSEMEKTLGDLKRMFPEEWVEATKFMSVILPHCT